MTSTRAPRPDYIAELTRELTLPFPPLPPDLLIIIASVLHDTLNDLRKGHETTLASGEEADITALMEVRLIALLDDDTSLWGQLAANVVRGKETSSFDARRLETRPDLSIHLVGRGPMFPLVVECKLMDRSTGKGVNLYCKDGLLRFVVGDYAWAVQEAFMLAYVRDGSSIRSGLAPRLGSGKVPDPYLVEEAPSPVSAGSMDLAVSRHGREFRYVEGVPGPISVWHLWVPVH